MEKKIKPKTSSVDSFQPDVVVYLDDIDFVNAMEGEEKKEFLQGASAIANGKILERLLNEMMNNLACHSILEAPTSEAIMFDRAGINSLNLLKSNIKKLDAMYNDIYGAKEEFDPNAVI
jgi:hypothetical protein